MKFIICFFIPLNIFCQSLKIEHKEKIFDNSDRLLTVNYIFEQVIEKDTSIMIDKKEVDFLLNKQAFSLEKLHFFNFERYLVLSNLDTIRCENDYDHYLPCSRNVKKYLLKKQDKVFYKVNIYNDYFINERIQKYNKLKNSEVTAKEIILKIVNQKTKLLTILYTYKVE